MNFKIERRNRGYVNTDPQRRCYNGCVYKGEWRWSEWDAIQWNVPEEEVKECLADWRDLHAYSRSVGSKQVCEFRAIEDI